MSIKRILYLFFADIISDIVFALLLLIPTFYYWKPDMPHMVGVAIAAVSMAFWIVARLQLGKSFTVLPEAIELKTAGLYRYFLNPIYYFSLLALSGILLSYGHSGIYVLCIIPLLYLQTIRMRKERVLLEARFGAQYVAYRDRVWF